MLNNMYMYLGKNVTQVDMGHVEPKGSTHQNTVLRYEPPKFCNFVFTAKLSKIICIFIIHIKPVEVFLHKIYEAI